MRRTPGHTIKDDQFMYLLVKTVAMATEINQFMVNEAAIALVPSTQQWIPLACFYVGDEKLNPSSVKQRCAVRSSIFSMASMR